MKRLIKNAIDRKKEIVDVARHLFLTREYDKTSMEEIVRTLGVAKGTVYHYFDSKEELLDAVVENLADEYVGVLTQIAKEMRGTALERLQALIGASRVTESQGETLEGLHRPGNIGLHARLLALLLKKMAPLYATIIEEGCKEGSFRTEHPLEVAEILLAGIQLMTDVGFYPWDKPDLARRASAIPALVEAQLGAAKGSFSFVVPV